MQATAMDFHLFGGRRRYNALRSKRARERRRVVLQLISQGRNQEEIAAELDVHPSTISRDLALLQRTVKVSCPHCRREILVRFPEHYDRLDR